MGIRTNRWANRAERFSTLGVEQDPSASPGATRLDSLTDVNVTEGSGINGYVLYWNNGAVKWEALSPAALAAAITPYLPSAGTLVGLTDVQITTSSGQDGYSVTWSNSLGKFVLTNVSGGGGGGGGTGIAFAKWATVQVSGTASTVQFDTTPGDAMTSSTTVGPVLPGGKPNQVLTMPTGAQFAQVTAELAVAGGFTGYVDARILRWQPAQSSPLNPATSSYTADDFANGARFLYTDGGTGGSAWWSIGPLLTEVNPGDQFSIDCVAQSGAGTVIVANISATVWGTGSNFTTGSGGGGGGSTTLAGLSDVSTAGETTGMSLLYNGSSYVFGYPFFTGVGPPSSGLGLDGAFYFDPTNGVFYGPKASGAWPAGITLPGGGGTTILTGSGAPGTMTGTTGDYYYDTSGGILYGPKGSPITWSGSPAAVLGFKGINYAYLGASSYNSNWGGSPHFPVPAGVSYVSVTAQVTTRMIVGSSGVLGAVIIQQVNSSNTNYGMTLNQAVLAPPETGGSFTFSATLSGCCAVAVGDYFTASTSGGTLLSAQVQVTRIG